MWLEEQTAESFICQKPALASSLENIVDPPICVRICSTDGKMCLSLRTLAFNFVSQHKCEYWHWVWARQPCTPICRVVNFSNYPQVFHLCQFLLHQWKSNSSWGGKCICVCILSKLNVIFHAQSSQTNEKIRIWLHKFL